MTPESPQPPTNPAIGHNAVITQPIGSNNPEFQPGRKRGFRCPTWLIVVLVALVSVGAVLAMAIGAVLLVATQPTELTASTYRDASGTQYSLQFYENAALKPASEMPGGGRDGGGISHWLVAPFGKYPLAIGMRLQEPDKPSLYDTEELCAHPILTLRTPAPGQSNIVCSIFTGGHEYMYFYEIHRGDQKYIVAIVQYFDGNNVPISEAQAFQEKMLNDPELDLRNFNEDLQTILPSIQVVE